MQPESFRARPLIERNNPGGSARKRGKRSKFSKFLIETKFFPLVLLGQCGQYFGFATVGSFLLGAASLYGYALFKPLPLARKAAEPSSRVSAPLPAQRTVQLRGLVRGHDNLPVKGTFTVAILANQLGPLQNSDGSFALSVPLSNSYNLAYWTTEDGRVRVFNGNTAEEDGNGYRLQNALVVPTEQFTSAIGLRPRVPKSRTEVARLESQGR